MKRGEKEKEREKDKTKVIVTKSGTIYHLSSNQDNAARANSYSGQTASQIRVKGKKSLMRVS